MKVSSSLLDELVTQWQLSQYDPGKHVTSRDLAEKMGISIDAALNHLEQERRAGKLERTRLIRNDHFVYAYFRPEN